MQIDSIAPRSSKQKAEQHFCIVKPLGSGAYADVFLAVPRAIVENMSSGFESGQRATASEGDKMAKLRSSLVALKIRTSSSFHDSMEREVKILQLLSHCQTEQALVIQLIEADANPLQAAWYTMPVCNGGDLESLLALTQSPAGVQLPRALAWRIAASLTRGLLFLHFGWQNGVSAPNWPVIAHNDLHCKNVLLRTATQSRAINGLEPYPEVLLADFGSAVFVDSRAEDEKRRHCARLRQHRDYNSLGLLLTPLYHRTGDPDLQRAIENVEGIKAPVVGLKNQHAFQVLKNLLAGAEKRAAELHKPLEGPLKEHLERQVVTDKALRSLLPRGAEGEIAKRGDAGCLTGKCVTS